MQRPWGRAVPEETGVLLEQSEPKREGRSEGREGRGEVLPSLLGCRRT